MALPTLQRKLFKNDGYGPEIKDERLSTDITVKDWDASHDYPANVLAKAGGDIYRSVAASGPGTSAGAVNPTQDASAVYWEVFGKGGSVPVGTVIWLSTSTVPVGFLLCNGQAVGRAAYPDLFGAIGTTYGAGDGSTTFNLPNLIDKFIEGANSNIGDSVAAGLPNITGNLTSRPNSNNATQGGIVTVARNAFSLSLQQQGSTAAATVSSTSKSGDLISFDASNSNSIYGNSSTVQPPAVKLLPCIKAYSGVDNLGSLDVAQLENYVQNSVVHLTGDEVINGRKIFNAVDTGDGESTVNVQSNDRFFFLEFKNTAYEYLFNNPSEQIGFGGLLFKDSNNQLAGNFRLDRLAGTDSSWIQLALWTPAAANKIAVYLNSPNSFFPQGNNLMLLGTSGHRWSAVWAATGTIQTSDERLKSNIEQFGDDVLDAWGDVNFVKFQYNDSLQEKGSSARLHSGLVAQHIEQAFRRRGLDASRYGLFCWDEWDADPEKGVEEAGEQYSLRYEEALCMEAAYQRRRAGRAEARIASLEARLAALEAKLNG